MNTKQAVDVLAQAFREDPSFGWTWHCNLAECAVAEGVDRSVADRLAGRFLKLAFDVETRECYAEPRECSGR